MNNYIKNKQLLEEIIISKISMVPTTVLIEYFQLLINKLANGKFRNSFKNTQDREDAIQDAFIILWNKWNSFDESKYTNAFAYLTELVKRSFVYSYKLRTNDKFVSINDYFGEFTQN